MTRTRLILVRHGETLANREFRYIGSRDDELTEPGRAQAMQLADALATLPITTVYSSPRQRAYYTAQPIAARHNLQVQRLNDLRETGFGAWEGMSRAEVLAISSMEAELLRRWEHDPTTAPPGGESLVAMHERVCALIERLAEEHDGQTIVLVSHVGPVKAVICEALDAPMSSASRIFLDPATISVVDWQQAAPIVRLVNSHGHLGWQQARWM